MPTRKATKTTKTKAEAKPRKSPFTIDEEISFGQIRTGDNKAVGVSLIRHENNRYVALSKMYLAKDGTYKSKGGIWIPFDSSNSVSNLIAKAYNNGVELGWDKPYIPPKQPEFELELETPPPAEPAEEVEEESSNTPVLPPEVSDTISQFSELIQQAQALSDKLQEQIYSAQNLQMTAEKTASNKSFIQKFLNIK